jgi:putative transposase
MPNTYTKIYIQFVFVVKYRDNHIQKHWKDELYKYITGITQNNGHKVIAINGMPDHVHLLVRFNPIQSLSELMRDVKASSSKWINERKFSKRKFSWQEGFGAFSYHESLLSIVTDYIAHQEEHHRKKSFRQEYLDLLKEFDVDFNPAYIFKEPE